MSKLNATQQNQINKQVKEYENHIGKGLITISLGDSSFVLEVDDYVASPLIMNSGIELVNYMVRRKEIFHDKVVVDMGCGSGIIGITAALLGARHVYMLDIEKLAIENTKKNIKRLDLSDKCTVIESDLFSKFSIDIKSDIHIFNHPYFAENPISDKPWTCMMLGGLDLLRNYLKQAPEYSHENTLYIFSWLDIAENQDQLDNNPEKCATESGYSLSKKLEVPSSGIGAQKGKFSFYEFKK